MRLQHVHPPPRVVRQQEPAIVICDRERDAGHAKLLHQPLSKVIRPLIHNVPQVTEQEHFAPLLR